MAIVPSAIHFPTAFHKVGENPENIDDRFIIVANPDKRYWPAHAEFLRNVVEWLDSDEEYEAWLESFAPGNFNLFVAIDKTTDKIVASVTGVNYQPNEPLNDQPYTIMGVYATRSGIGGRGIGTELTRRVFAASAGKWRGCHGTPLMTQKYSRDLQFEAQPWMIQTLYIDMHNLRLQGAQRDRNLQILSAPDECGWQAINEYYGSYLPELKMDEMLRAILAEKGSLNLVAQSQDGGRSRIVGFIRVRKLPPRIISICPLLAETPLAASTLLCAALERCTGEQDAHSRIIFEVPVQNDHLQHLLAQISGDTATIDPNHWYQPQHTRPMSLPLQKIYSMSHLSVAIV